MLDILGFLSKDDRRIPGKSQDLLGIDNDCGYWIKKCTTSWQPFGRNGSFPTCLHGAPSCAGMLHLNTSQCLKTFQLPPDQFPDPDRSCLFFLRPCTKFATGLFFALLQKGCDYWWVPTGHSKHLFLASFGGQRQLLLSAALDFLV